MDRIILPEIVMAGVYDAQNVYRDRMQTPARTTTMFELELPIGNGGISYIGKEKQNITDNVIICAKPGVIRHTKLPYRCYFVHMIVSEGLLWENLMRLPPYIPIEGRDEYEPIFKQLSHFIQNSSPRRNILYMGKLLELIYLLSSLNNRISDPKNETVIRAISYIKDHLENDLSLTSISTYAGLSPTYFHNLFKKYTGKTLREYIEEQRIKKSTELLVSTDMTLASIAYACGFSSQSYFSYAFKRKTNMTPREYAENYFRKYEQ